MVIGWLSYLSQWFARDELFGSFHQTPIFAVYFVQVVMNGCEAGKCAG